MTKELVNKYIKSYGDIEIPIDEMYYNESKSTGINMRSFLEDFAEDILDQQTKELQQKVEQLQFELKAADSVNEQLQAKIDELESELTIQKEKVKLNYNHAIDLQAKCCKCEVLGDLAPCDECYYGRTN